MHEHLKGSFFSDDLGQDIAFGRRRQNSLASTKPLERSMLNSLVRIMGTGSKFNARWLLVSRMRLMLDTTHLIIVLMSSQTFMATKKMITKVAAGYYGLQNLTSNTAECNTSLSWLMVETVVKRIHLPQIIGSGRETKVSGAKKFATVEEKF